MTNEATLSLTVQVPRNASSSGRQLFSSKLTPIGSRVAKGLRLDIKEVEGLANMTREERAKATV